MEGAYTLDYLQDLLDLEFLVVFEFLEFVIDSFSLEEDHIAVILFQPLCYLSYLAELLVMLSEFNVYLLLMLCEIASHLLHPFTTILLRVLKLLHQQLDFAHPGLGLAILPKANVQFRLQFLHLQVD